MSPICILECSCGAPCGFYTLFNERGRINFTSESEVTFSAGDIPSLETIIRRRYLWQDERLELNVGRLITTNISNSRELWEC